MGISSGGFGRPFPLGPAPVPTRPPARGSPVLRTLWVGGSEAVLGAQRPVARPAPGGGAVRYCVPFGWSRLLRGLGAQRPGGPACPAGVPISPEKWGERGPGPSVIGRQFRWNHCRVDPATWVPRRLRRGSPTFFGESRRKEHQGSALDPGFYGRSFPLAGFGDGCLWPVRGSISSGILRPIWDVFSRKICWKAFL